MNPTFEQHIQQQTFMLAEGQNTISAWLSTITDHIAALEARIEALERAKGRAEQ